MERNILRQIQGYKKYPSVSILLPTSRTAPENHKDKLVLKKLFRDAEKRLLNEFDKRSMNGLLEKLKKNVESVDVRHNLDGLALFINNDFEKIVRLPFPVRERVIVDETFATRDLIRAMNRSISYYTLSLSAEFVRLFEGYRDTLTEITERGFPFANPIPRGSNLELSTSLKETRLKEFFNQVDKAFLHIYRNNPKPLIFTGVERNIAAYRDVADKKNIILATFEGNHDHTPVHELAKLAWPIVREKMREKRKQMTERINNAISAHKFVSGLEEAWRLANEERGEILFVEESYHQPVKFTDNGNSFVKVDNPGNETSTVDDLVDEIADKVVSTGGRVVFTEDGELSKYDRIGLILKY